MLFRSYRVNIFGMFRLCKVLLPQMKKGGSIINTGSIQSFDPSANLIAYASTKAAIVSFTRSLASLAIKQGVRVNAVAPLLFEEASQHQVGEEVSPLMAAVAKKTPFGHEIPTSSGIARTIAALLSGDMRYVTGQVFKVDGGYSIGL